MEELQIFCRPKPRRVAAPRLRWRQGNGADSEDHLPLHRGTYLIPLARPFPLARASGATFCPRLFTLRKRPFSVTLSRRPPPSRRMLRCP
jgi:hypothetical protein